MSYKDTAQKILNAIGGKENVNRVTHCVTRLRLELKDENLVNDNDVKKIPGVIGIMKKNGQYQIILGNDVANYYKEFIKLGNFELDAVEQAHKGNILERIIEYIAGSMTPIIPAMLGGGMLKVLVIILPMLGILKSDSQTGIFWRCSILFLTSVISVFCFTKIKSDFYISHVCSRCTTSSKFCSNGAVRESS